MTSNNMRFINTRSARNTSAAIVAGIAGYASYWHQVEVAQLAGERDELAHVLPLSVDGLLVVASVAMVDARAEGRRPGWKTKLGFIIGIAASVGANVMSAQPTVLGRLVAAWPALALLLVVEILASKGKRIAEQTGAGKVITRPVPAPVPQADPTGDDHGTFPGDGPGSRAGYNGHGAASFPGKDTDIAQVRGGVSGTRVRAYVGTSVDGAQVGTELGAEAGAEAGQYRPAVVGTDVPTQRPGRVAAAARPSRRPSVRASAGTDRPQDVAALLPAAAAVQARLAAAGRALTRDALVTGLREDGVPVSNARGTALYAALNTATTPDVPPATQPA